MLDTKLKNRHKLAVILIIVTIFLTATSVVEQYSTWYWQADANKEEVYKNIVTSQEFLEKFVEATYILYNQEERGLEEEGVECAVENAIEAQCPGILEDFDEFYPYLEFAVTDENGDVVENKDVTTESLITKSNLSQYQTAIVIMYDEEGTPHVSIKAAEYTEEQSVTLRQIVNESELLQGSETVQASDDHNGFMYVDLNVPKDRSYILALSKENQALYIDEQWGLEDQSVAESMGLWLVGTLLIIAAAAWIYPLVPSFRTGEEKIFKIPLEIAVIIFTFVLEVALYSSWGRIMTNCGHANSLDYMIWSAAFFVTYWVSGVLRPIYQLGIKQYLKERTLIGVYGKRMKNVVVKYWRKLKDKAREFYHALEQIDLTQKDNKILVKIVIVNFAVLLIICLMWVFGVGALIIYSFVLFWFLRKYYNSIQEKYERLLKATNEIAEGNLDVKIEEDLGIFNPFKPEIEKIQSGFKNAVEKEVKSQRMKTELVTNVSHDLKTPLTAIITYVNLLKEEKDEEKRKEYIEVLDKKSMRLKVLIEDLFEISKVSSKTVSLNIMDVDIVSLFKQVKLETEEKFEGTGLDFRCNYLEEALVVPLDSQKTYRIFENLLVNVAKYAMPNTRVYVEILCEGEKAVLRMKNISAAELTFDASDITERFVRGDEARNTEGSGLGLAIAKSFTEVQKGEFKVDTDGDLFKVEVKFIVAK